MSKPTEPADWLPPPRRLVTWDDLRPLVSIGRPILTLEERLAAASTIWDLRRIARQRIPRSVFDYVDGGAMEEITLQRSRTAYRRVTFHARVLRDVTDVDLTTSILGTPSSLPVALAPTGFTRLMHHEGEQAVAWAAAVHGLVYSLSTLGTTSPEDLARRVPQGAKWFQLYVDRDRELARDLISRARASGYQALMLTVDTATGGTRLRDLRNGLSVPPRLTLRSVFDMARKPRWWFNLLTHEPLRFAALESTDGDVGGFMTRVLDPALDLDSLAWVKSEWDGPVVVKGIQTVEDAVLVERLGCDGIVLSNHGGRQLDRSVTTLELLPRVRHALSGTSALYIDGGVMSGADVLAAVAWGADAVFVGRAYLYGLMAGGHRGVDRAIRILRTEMEQTMRLLGVSRLSELDSGFVALEGSPG